MDTYFLTFLMKKLFLGTLVFSFCVTTFAGSAEQIMRSVGPAAIMAAGVG
ncbi:hypothetical protein H6768_02895 [Candidatus Peribacteria bacterium]|nr:hypothetical protein [Candidatus Peribacteria bacterium]